MSTPDMRPTMLGLLPVDVNTIDRLDEALTFLRDVGLKRQAQIAALQEELRGAQLAIEYADAHTRRREICEIVLQGKNERMKAWEQAKKAYRRWRREEDDY